MSKASDLAGFLFDGKSSRLSNQLTQWMEYSTRFLDFAGTHRDKIRKKIRVAPEAERLLDLGGELEVAYLLLNDRRLDVEYEPYASLGTRGADFRVTYRVNLKFNIEVARMRAETSEPARLRERAQRIVLGKFGQMQPNMPNLLVLHVNRDISETIDLGKLMQELKTRAESRDPGFYELGAYAGPAEFFRDFRRLNGILIWEPYGQLWINKQAQVALDEKVLRLIRSKVVQPATN